LRRKHGDDARDGLHHLRADPLDLTVPGFVVEAPEIDAVPRDVVAQ
jgi:hypothetical protein